MMWRAFGWFGVFMGAVFGAIVGTWAQQPYPVSIIERNVLTPVVKPGDDLRIEVVIDRRTRCDQEITGYLQYPDGSRTAVLRELPSTYGRLGRDVYVLRVHTDPHAPMGPAERYSVGEATCNLYQSVMKHPAISGDPWIDRFQFGPETKEIPGKWISQHRTDAVSNE